MTNTRSDAVIERGYSLSTSSHVSILGHKYDYLEYDSEDWVGSSGTEERCPWIFLINRQSRFSGGQTTALTHPATVIRLERIWFLLGYIDLFL